MSNPIEPRQQAEEPSLPVIFQLDDNGEATGYTLRFCSAPCRAAFRADPTNAREIEEPTADGDEAYHNQGEICTQCNEPLDLPRFCRKVAHRLTDRELATVLAALCQWQMDWEANPVELAESIHFKEQTPLTSAELDTLCDRLNTPGEVP